MPLGGWTQPSAAPHSSAIYPPTLLTTQPANPRRAGAICHWGCDEDAAASAIVERVDYQGSNRDLTVTNVGIGPSLFQESRTIASPIVRGSRVFNGTTSYARQPDPDRGYESGIFVDGGQLGEGEQRGATVALWLQPSSLPASGNGTLIAYANDVEPITSDNCIWSLRIGTFGQLFTRIIGTNGTTTVDDTMPYNFAAGEIGHVAVTWEVDPSFPGGLYRRARWWLNGRCIRVGPPVQLSSYYTFGGSTARWWMGARPLNSTTRGDFYAGALDDVVVLGFPATTEWVRRQYARGIQDFSLNFENPAGFYNNVDITRGASVPMCETHVRVLVQDRFSAILDNVANAKLLNDTRVRRVADAEGYVDVTDLYGFNWLLDAEISEDADNQSQSATVKLVTRIGEMSVAPYMLGGSQGTGSGFGQNPINWNDVFLRENNRVKIEFGCVPIGTGRHGVWPHWHTRFDGLIQRVEAGEEATTITCIDKMSALQDVWIEPDGRTGLDHEYGSLAGMAVEDCLQLMIDDNDPARFEILAIDDNGPGGVTNITTMSSTGSPAPGKAGVWKAGDSIMIEGTGRTQFDSYQYQPYVVAFGYDGVNALQLNYNPTALGLTSPAFSASGRLYGSPDKMSYIGRKPFIYVPTSPGWLVTPVQRYPASGNLSTALEALAAAIGFAVRYAWDDERCEFRLTLSRFQGIETFLLPILRCLSVGGQSFDKEDARTVVIAEYSDYTDLDVLGQPKRHIVGQTNPAIRDRVGRRYARIGLASNDLISDASEAQEFVDAIAQDLGNPQGDTDIEFLYNPLVVIGAQMGMQAESTYGQIIPRSLNDSSSFLGITAVKTRVKDGCVTTTVTTRQQASTRRRKNQDLFQQPGYNGGKGLTPPATSGITGAIRTLRIQPTGSTPCGALVQWTHPKAQDSAKWDFTEVYASGTNGFTPGATSFRGTTRGTSFMMGGLIPSTTHYFKIILRDRMGNASAAIDLGSAVTPA